MYARGTVMGSQLGTDGAEYGVGRGPAVGGFAGESSAYVGEDIAEESRGWMPKNAPRGAVMTDAGAGAFKRAIDALHKDAALSAGGVLRAAAEHAPGAVLDAAPGERAVVPRVREAA